MALEFQNKITIITGAGRGLGKLAAQEFAAKGAFLVINDLDEAIVKETIKELKADGHNVVGLAGDISLEDTSAQLVALAIEEFGGLDIAINNAGIAQEQVRLHETDSDLAQRIVQINLMGVFFAMKHQLPAMMTRFGETGEPCSILNLASAAGVMGSPKLAAYAAAKHGVVGLTRSAALEYARKGIRINALCPAFTRTRMVTDLLKENINGEEAATAKLVSNNPMGRLGEQQEIVQAMVWASSPQNSFFNGQTLSIDGGLRSF